MSNSAEKHRVEPLLRPRVIAVIGASRRDDSVGRRVLTSIASSKFAGTVYGVNPNYETIGRIPCFPTIAALPKRPDCVVLCVKDAAVEEALRSAAAAGVPAAVIFGRGFDADAEVPISDRLADIAREAGIVICGGNCMGFLNSIDDLRVSFGAPRIEGAPSGVSVVVHSGSMWEWLIGNRRNIVFDFAVSAGQEIATSCADYIDYFLDQQDTKVVGCVLETVRDPKNFVAALEKARSRNIPIVVLKLGRTEKGRHFARAHTGALTASYAIYEALFAHYGVVTVDTLDELLDTLEIFRFGFEAPQGGIAVLTHSGGERQIIVDTADRVGAPIAELTERSASELSEVLEPGLSPENPVDAWGDGKLVGRECLDILSRDPNVSVVALAADLFFSAGMGYSLQVAEHASMELNKPFVVFGCMHGSVVPEAAARLRAFKIPVLSNVEGGLKAMKHLINYHQYRRSMECRRNVNRHEFRFSQETDEARTTDLRTAENILKEAGIPLPEGRFADNKDEVNRAGKELGYPVVLKTANPAIEHKTEVGGVIVGLANEADLEIAYASISAKCGPQVQIQKQIPKGTEILIGMVRDEQFGPVVTLALGGVMTEVLRDSVSFIPPIGRDEALVYLQKLRAFPLLTGFRGQPSADLGSLCDLIEAFSVMCSEVGDRFSEVEINPVIAGSAGSVAVDALFVRNHNANIEKQRPIPELSKLAG